ncbi:MAG: LVIVD repeat-containing protein [Gemmatimonas sp.]
MKSRLLLTPKAALGTAAIAVTVAACMHSGGTSTGASTGSGASAAKITSPTGYTVSGDVSLSNSPAFKYPSNAPVKSPDPRIGLKAGASAAEAGSAAWNMALLSTVLPSEGFAGRGATGSDFAFKGKYAIQGNYRGFQIWDIENPRAPKLVVGFLCPSSQGDPTVYGDLVFISGEANGSRNDCGTTSITDTVSKDRFRGIRVVDISNPAKPRVVTNIQTCRGSHTNTLVQDPKDKENIYIYVSGYSQIRSGTELSGCQDGEAGDSLSARFRIEVIKVPLKHPEQAKVVNSPHLLADLQGRTVHAPPPSDTGGRGGRGGAGGGRGGAPGAAGAPAGRGGAPAPAGRGGAAGGRGNGIGQSGCHDITSYPDIGYAGGACAGYGLVFNIKNAANPSRLTSVADSNMSFWHSATFSNDGSKLLFSDEWGGGTAPRCRATDKLEWGGNTIFTLSDAGKLTFKSYYKMPAPQTNEETCTAHNGNLIPVPGRDIMVQAFYQGGATVFDWTDPAKPIEIAFFDRGPGGGYWSTYWYNGYIYSSDETRGMDVHELVASPYLSQNEIDAAKSVITEQYNAQEQNHYTWPASFALAGAYLDQLERNQGLAAARIAAVRAELASAQKASGGERAKILATSATTIAGDVNGAADRGRVALLQNAVVELSKKK